MKYITLFSYFAFSTLVPLPLGNNSNIAIANQYNDMKEDNYPVRASSDRESESQGGTDSTRRLLNKKQTQFCRLTASISCKDKRTKMDCGAISPFNTAQCQSHLDFSYDIVYTAMYKNKNNNGGIKFYQEANPNNDKDYTFAKSNRIEIDIKKEQVLKPGEKRVFQTTRRIDPCNLNVKYYIGETILHGKVQGKKGKKYQCRGYDFYKEDILTYYQPMPTSVPSFSPSGVPTLMPSKGKGKGGKGKSDHALKFNNLRAA
jgi:hypothetical protein